MEKRCSICKETKPDLAFYKASKYKDGFQSACKECQHKSQRDRKEYRADWMSVKRAKIVEYIRSLKEAPCTDCGIQFPPHIMQFDHVRGVKRFNLGSAQRYVSSTKTIDEEVAKCELVCAHCHIDREFRRKYFDEKIGGDAT
jgi:hypothetical protein